MPSNPLSVDVKTTSGNNQQLKNNMGSLVPEALKVRKPYTITKQRERWTEEEHNRFLEALKLYGRAWRQIEEHIGTKTAVQIRSHAQKFFTKVSCHALLPVSRESAGESSGEVKSIEIPPPRPKRKPMHPYPRKLGNSPGIPVTEKSEWSLVPKFLVPGQDSIQIPNQPATEQDNLSPTSVLSAVGSDTFGSSASEIMNNSSTSPATSGDGSEPIGTSGDSVSEQENVCQSAMTSVEDEDKSLLQNKSDMELDGGTNDSISCKEASPVEAPTTSLKLFGRTVTVAGSQKPFSSPTKNYCEVNAHDGVLPSGEATSNWNSWPNGVTPMFYLLPSHGNLSSSPNVSLFPMPWLLQSYQDATLALTNSQSVSSEKERGEVSDTGDVHKGWRLSKTSAFRSLKATTNKPAKGFVPYRRCIAEEKVDNQMMVNDKGDGQGVQLCL